MANCPAVFVCTGVLHDVGLVLGRIHREHPAVFVIALETTEEGHQCKCWGIGLSSFFQSLAWAWAWAWVWAWAFGLSSFQSGLGMQPAKGAGQQAGSKGSKGFG
jgi:hypothetical protein